MSAQSEPEWTTRKLRIDARLRAWGWDIVAHRPDVLPSTYRRHAVTEYETDNGPADYALFVDGRPVAIIEAKRIAVSPANAIEQAARYGRGVRHSPFRFGDLRVPFLYATNGAEIRFRDARHAENLAAPLADFHTPAALAEKLAHDTERARQWLADNPPQHRDLRPYQRQANLDVEAALARGQRRLLVAMATGTGKTYTLVSQIHRLMKSGLARRVLFLVDRRALAAQAVRAFKTFEAEPNLRFDRIYEVFSQRFQREDFGEDEDFDPQLLPREYYLDPKPSYAFVYISTIQRLARKLFGAQALGDGHEGGDNEDAGDDERESIPIHAFDLIVADECHRGYTAQQESAFRETLQYFDAIKIGLTATPAAHTTAWFGPPAFRYSYEDAVREGHLVDYDLVKIKSDIRLKGVFLAEGEEVTRIDPVTGQRQMDFLEDERQFEPGELERRVTAPDSNRKILEAVKRHADEHELRYGRFPKTLIFAANDLDHRSHAQQLVDLAREVFGRGHDFVQKITGNPNVDRPLQRIREFRNRRQIGIVVTVDMLTTGVDIPDLEYLVFLRPVQSRILFEQMIGRGTRKSTNFSKSHFTVFDCFDGTLVARFKDATGVTAESPVEPSKPIAAVIDAIWKGDDRDYHVGVLVKRLQRIDRVIAPEGRDDLAPYVGDLGIFAKNLRRRLGEDFAATMGVLREKAVLRVLSDPPRIQTRFIVATAARDHVASEWLPRDAAGNAWKPDDYLAAFARFVLENPEHIEAIEILLHRPRGWRPGALDELRARLRATELRFTEDQLQRAFELRHRKPLVDIISMVKRAASDEAPLLSKAERVDRAIARLTGAERLGEEQAAWMQRIRDHLVENLAIDRDDFNDQPVFERAGGWGRANRAFGGNLADWLIRINEAVAA